MNQHCPLKFSKIPVKEASAGGDMRVYPKEATLCGGASCAWWIKRTQECAVKQIAVESKNLIALQLGNRID